MKYLDFKGQYGIKGSKIKQWNYFWKGQQVGGGQYNLFGQKVGKWIDLCENYWDKKNVIEEGHYLNDRRIGVWKTQWNNQAIGEGSYDMEGEGKKKGKWIEIIEFQVDSQVSQEGEYQNGVKVGRWDIFQFKRELFYWLGFCIYDLQGNLSQEKQNNSIIIYNRKYNNARKYGKWDIWFKNNNRDVEKQIIGGGSYDEGGKWVKNGKWIDCDDDFELKKQITYNGEYRNGKKIGQWNIMYKGGKIGGGSYDERGDEIKIGEWIEVADEFNDDFQITNKGEYQNGKRFGRWDSLIRGKQYGGGQYLEDSKNSKIGKWIEISKEFKDYFQITYEGQYKNGTKFGRWTNMIKGKKIGGGQYEGDSKNSKIGKWIDVTEEFKENQITQKGEYKNGKKFGRWDIIFQGKCYGGGFYGEGDGNVKIGKWIVLDYEFRLVKQVSFIGEYRNGKKNGRWDIQYKGEKIGGGFYDESGSEIKIGKWIDISETFKDNSQITYQGEYQSGKKIGQWIIHYQGEQIGGGLYDEINGDIKLGKWIDISEMFKDSLQIIYKGEYKGGKRFGRWDIHYKGQQIGGGSYEVDRDIKIGQWIDISDIFNDNSQITFTGEYKGGKKIGRWDIYYKGRQIGGGCYDESGSEIKIGKWIDISETFKDNSQITYQGEYKSSKKFGRWDIRYKGEQNNFIYLIGGGSYDDNCGDIKIGKWVDIDENFWWISSEGEYKKGLKYGRWDTKIKGLLVGGGQYDEIGNGIKVGEWIEINENCQSITYVGQYKNGLKFGKWEIKNQGLLIGGGSYGEIGNGIKIGKWIDIDVKFCFFYQITHKGEYRNGNKIGQWDIWQQNVGLNNKNRKIGGGSYDEDGNEFKIGKWTDFEYELRQEKIVIFNGIYENGNKVGRWNVVFEGSEIGGGLYDQDGDGIKIGKWIDLDENFYQEKQITHIGKYINGRKTGQWDIYWNWNENERIGGGVYDEEGNGFKVGEWIDLDDDFNYWKQKILNGEYIKGKKVGSWQEMYLNNKKNGNLRRRNYEF